MRPVSVIAAAALSALGRGRLAYGVGDIGERAPSGLVIAPQIAAIRQPLFAPVSDDVLDAGSEDRAERLLTSAARDLAVELDLRAPGWRTARLGVLIGTSSGAMQTLETALRLRAQQQALPAELARAANYFSPLAGLFDALGVDPAQTSNVQILAACASSTIALGVGCRWLDADACELVIAGGYDALSALVASGFDALSALTRSRPSPFRVGRDGMALGEGAGLVALRLSRPGESAFGRVLGFSASSDAVHVTAPDRQARGLIRAARAALADSQLDASAIDLVSAHATATPFNDAAEARGLRALFGERAVAVQPWKAAIGHTLGAAGVLESLATWDALARGVVPAAGSEGELDPGAEVRLLETNQAGSPGAALKLSAAFGGCNAALVLGPARGEPLGSGKRDLVDVAVRAFGPRVTQGDPELLTTLLGEATPLAGRADSLSELVLAAVARLLPLLTEALPEATAVIVGTSAATLELDEVFDRRRRAGEAVEPRRFPPTSPNLCASVCSICFGLRGPSFSVGATLEPGREALLVASDLVRAGDAPAALVVVAEDVGQVVTDLFGAAGFRVPSRGARAALVAPGPGWPLSRSDLGYPSGEPGRELGPLRGFFSSEAPGWP
jgi:3-oxoacyl-[acyl-carrier-protein] synthase-1/3-oxoacyl-[acyl-carrier-protein] synthase II